MTDRHQLAKDAAAAAAAVLRAGGADWAAVEAIQARIVALVLDELQGTALASDLAGLAAHNG